MPTAIMYCCRRFVLVGNELLFKRQFACIVFAHPTGFIVDFYCHSMGLIIEVDGEIHNQQKEYDRHRETVLSNKNLNIIRFTNEQVINNIEGVLKAIALNI